MKCFLCEKSEGTIHVGCDCVSNTVCKFCFYAVMARNIGRSLNFKVTNFEWIYFHLDVHDFNVQCGICKTIMSFDKNKLI